MRALSERDCGEKGPAREDQAEQYVYDQKDKDVGLHKEANLVDDGEANPAW